MARWGDGFIAGGGGPEAARASYDSVLEQWDEMGREGQPRFVSAAYFALGADAEERISSYIGDYYSFMPEYAEIIASAAPSNPEQVRDTLRAYEDVGIDEFLLWPCNPSLNQWTGSRTFYSQSLRQRYAVIDSRHFETTVCRGPVCQSFQPYTPLRLSLLDLLPWIALRSLTVASPATAGSC